MTTPCLPPDPNVPGVHHLRDANGRNQIARWGPGAGRWGVLFGGTHLPETLARAGWTYLEPVLTPAEVDELHVELHNLAVQVAEMQDKIMGRETERDDYKSRWDVLQRALVGDTGLSAILTANNWAKQRDDLTAERDEARAQAADRAAAIVRLSGQLRGAQTSLDARSEHIRDLIAARRRLERQLHVLAPDAWPDPEGETGK